MLILLTSFVAVGVLYFAVEYFWRRKKITSKQRELNELELEGDVLDLDKTVVETQINLQTKSNNLHKLKGKLND